MRCPYPDKFVSGCNEAVFLAEGLRARQNGKRTSSSTVRLQQGREARQVLLRQHRTRSPAPQPREGESESTTGSSREAPACPGEGRHLYCVQLMGVLTDASLRPVVDMYSQMWVVHDPHSWHRLSFSLRMFRSHYA